MKNNFSVDSKVCGIHNLPQAFICIADNCRSQNLHPFNVHYPNLPAQNAPSLLCSDCVASAHPHAAKVFSFEQFTQHFQAVIQLLSTQLTSQVNCSSVSTLIKSKKQEIQHKQLRMFETLIQQITEEKKQFFLKLDQIQLAASQYQQKYYSSIRQREKTLNYLLPYADKNLLELKLMCGSDIGIEYFKREVIRAQVYANGQILRNKNAEIEKRINALSIGPSFQQLANIFISKQQIPQLTFKKVFRNNNTNQSPIKYRNLTPQGRPAVQVFYPLQSPRYNPLSPRDLNYTPRNQSMQSIPKVPSNGHKQNQKAY